jgi:hypothetical protein
MPTVTISACHVTRYGTPSDARPVRGFAFISRCGEMIRCAISR